VVGGSSTDVITCGAQITGTHIDPGAGDDTLTLFRADNTVTVANIESIIGNTGSDVVMMDSASYTGRMLLGAGLHSLTLGERFLLIRSPEHQRKRARRMLRLFAFSNPAHFQLKCRGA